MRKLNKTEYEKMRLSSKVLESDAYGDKVLRLEDGIFLKLFRLKHIFSGKRIYPNCMRFTRNASILKKRDIATVDVLERVRIPHLRRTGVLYQPLAGQTLRQIAAAGEINKQIVFQFGAFVAGLHQKGILFRSLHMGNVLLCGENEFGLIDISDMKSLPFSLPCSIRSRNFRHLFRYKQDFKILTNSGIESFVDGYMSKSSNTNFKKKLFDLIEQFKSKENTTNCCCQT